ncbi:MAG: hypothetical protein AB8B92_01520 [Gammaproteobacteria bacterium]
MISIESKFKSLFILSALAVICLFSGSTYAAGYGVQDINVISKKTFVLNDGEKYTEVKPGVIAASENLSADVHVWAAVAIGVIKNWSTWLELRSEAGSLAIPTVEFKDHSFSHSYPKNSRPSEVDRTVKVVVPRSAITNLFATQCNRQAETLRNQGLSNQEIFSKNRSISYRIVGRMDASFTKLPSTTFVGADDENDTAEIVCMKAPGPSVATASDLQTNTGVTNSSLTIIEQSTVGGACKVNLSSAIHTNLPNTTVKYRYEHVNGKKSDVKTVVTDHSKTAMDAHWYDVPKDPNQAEAGSVRIVGVSHNFESAWQSYNMTCNESSPNSVSVVHKPVLKEFSLIPLNNVMYNGMICPTKIRVTARVMSKKTFNGRGNITMKSGNYAFATHDVNLEPFAIFHHSETFDLKPWNTINAPVGNAGGSNTWQTAPSSGPATPSQRFELRYILSVGNKNVIESPFKTISVQCTAPKVNQHVLPSNNGGLTTPKKPTINKQEINKQQINKQEIKKLKVAPVKKLSQPTKMQQQIIKK